MRVWPAAVTTLGKRKLAVTAEHLIARALGGKDSAANIVAACMGCNSARSVEIAKQVARDKEKAA